MMEFDFERSDYFITAVSDAKDGYLRGDTSTHFFNHFPEPLNFHSYQYECGLTEISFVDKYIAKHEPEPSPEPPAPTKPVPTKPTYFNDTNNKLELSLKYETAFEFSKDKLVENYIPKSVAAFITGINQRFQRGNVPVLVEISSRPGETESRTVLTFTDPLHRSWSITPELAKVLGFRPLQTYPTGKHYSENFQSELEYQNLPNDKVVGFTTTRWETSFVKIKEPKNYNLPSLFDSIHDALEEKDIGGVSFILSKDGRILTIVLDTEDVEVQLPQHINKLLGLDRGYRINKLRVELLLPSVSPPQPATNGGEEKVSKPNHGYVLTNVIKAQCTGSKLLPVARVFLRETKTGENHYHYKFSPVYYQPVSSNKVVHVQVSLVDSSFNSLEPTETPTICVFHFRPKRF